MWHLIGLKSRRLIHLRDGFVSVDSKGVTQGVFVSVESKEVSIGGPRGCGDVHDDNHRWEVEKRVV